MLLTGYRPTVNVPPADDHAAAPTAAPPHRVAIPVNRHRWVAISFLHWPFAPQEVAALLPEGLTVDTHGGRAWVGVTPFVMHVRVPGVPWVPAPAVFPETNLRTYVRGPDGRQGLWFLHMEVTAAWFVATLRPLGLPYVRRPMRVIAGDRRIDYVSVPESSDAGGHDIAVHPGPALDPPHGGPFARFLTARWGAYHRVGGGLRYTPVDHPPWRLHRAEAEIRSIAGLFRVAGLSTPVAPPIAHFSPGVGVRVGLPQRVRRCRSV